MTALEKALARADSSLNQSIEQLFELLRIRSISTDPAHAPDCRRAGQWLVDRLTELGFSSTLRDTAGHPMVIGHRKGPKGAPHVLFYGHYDVQPADPLEKWQTPPFEPVRRTDSDGIERIYARGASDDKGQLMTFLEASRAFVEETGELPLSITMLIEGEEEMGSPNVATFLKDNRDELRADVALICDTEKFDNATPAITTRLRGLVHMEVTVTGPSIDLHSGMYGGPAINPIRVLAGIIAALHDDAGRVAIPGFYDRVREVPEATRRQWADLPMDELTFLAQVGLKQSVGEKGYSVLEQIWSRPTAEVNGIYGGYTGVGTKTVIPSTATAKLSFRLVADQDPDEIRTMLRRFVEARLPAGATVAIQEGSGSRAVHVGEDNPYLVAASEALTAEWRKAPVLMGGGGSIPIVGNFQRELGMESLLIGFANDADAIHSPNERYDVEGSYHKGIRSWIRVIDALSGTG